MKHIYNYIICLTILSVAACSPGKRITGSKQNGSHYVLTIQRAKADSIMINGSIRVVDPGSVDNVASRGLLVFKSNDSSYMQIVVPDDAGNFSCTVSPGKYYLSFGGVGFGKMRTSDFYVKPGQILNLAAVLYPEVEDINDYILNYYPTKN